MIVTPESSSRFTVRSETLAEDFLLKQFMIAWRDGEASISMDVQSQNGRARLEISNQPPKMLPIKETLQSKITRLFL